jgi:hypothetical protein
MQKGEYLTTILRSSKTVFSTKDIALLWHEPGSTATRVRLHSYVKKDALYRIRKGLYAKNRSYNRLELATRIYTPSYVSFETVLVKEGLIFQYYDNISVASYLNRQISVDGQTYTYRKIKTSTLVNSAGVHHLDETSIASRERAFLDTLYANPDYQFDNTGGLNWELVFNILPIYRNKRLQKTVIALHNSLPT